MESTTGHIAFTVNNNIVEANSYFNGNFSTDSKVIERSHEFAKYNGTSVQICRGSFDDGGKSNIRFDYFYVLFNYCKNEASEESTLQYICIPASDAKSRQKGLRWLLIKNPVRFYKSDKKEFLHHDNYDNEFVAYGVHGKSNKEHQESLVDIILANVRIYFKDQDVSVSLHVTNMMVTIATLYNDLNNEFYDQPEVKNQLFASKAIKEFTKKTSILLRASMENVSRKYNNFAILNKVQFGLCAFESMPYITKSIPYHKVDPLINGAFKGKKKHKFQYSTEPTKNYITFPTTVLEDDWSQIFNIDIKYTNIEDIRADPQLKVLGCNFEISKHFNGIYSKISRKMFNIKTETKENNNIKNVIKFVISGSVTKRSGLFNEIKNTETKEGCYSPEDFPVLRTEKYICNNVKQQKLTDQQLDDIEVYQRYRKMLGKKRPLLHDPSMEECVKIVKLFREHEMTKKTDKELRSTDPDYNEKLEGFGTTFDFDGCEPRGLDEIKDYYVLSMIADQEDSMNLPPPKPARKLKPKKSYSRAVQNTDKSEKVVKPIIYDISVKTSEDSDSSENSEKSVNSNMLEEREEMKKTTNSEESEKVVETTVTENSEKLENTFPSISYKKLPSSSSTSSTTSTISTTSIDSKDSNEKVEKIENVEKVEKVQKRKKSNISDVPKIIRKLEKERRLSLPTPKRSTSKKSDSEKSTSEKSDSEKSRRFRKSKKSLKSKGYDKLKEHNKNEILDIVTNNKKQKSTTFEITSRVANIANKQISAVSEITTITETSIRVTENDNIISEFSEISKKALPKDLIKILRNFVPKRKEKEANFIRSISSSSSDSGSSIGSVIYDITDENIKSNEILEEDEKSLKMLESDTSEYSDIFDETDVSEKSEKSNKSARSINFAALLDSNKSIKSDKSDKSLKSEKSTKSISLKIPNKPEGKMLYSSVAKTPPISEVEDPQDIEVPTNIVEDSFKPPKFFSYKLTTDYINSSDDDDNDDQCYSDNSITFSEDEEENNDVEILEKQKVIYSTYAQAVKKPKKPKIKISELKELLSED